MFNFCYSGEGNGCVRFVEIATQTVNVTGVLTNLNSSVTNSSNTSEPCGEQNELPIKLNVESADSIHQPYNQKNNGHCIFDGNSNNGNSHVIQEHQSDDGEEEPNDDDDKVSGINESAGLETQIPDAITNTDGLKHGMNDSVTTTDINEDVETPIETDSTADDMDIGKKSATIDGTNGPANDLRV